MSTHLTDRGRWLFGSALLFLTAGTVAIRPALVVFGAVQLACLLVAYLLGTRGALVLDRRLVDIQIHPADSTSGQNRHRGSVVGDSRTFTVSIRNPSVFDIIEFDLDPFAPDQLSMELDGERRTVASGETETWEATVTADQSGRWVFQGFDVNAVDPLGWTRNRDYLASSHPFEF